MKNQFYYTRKQQLPPVEGETEPQFKEFLDSFNPELAIRSVLLGDGRRVVVLNDFHEELREVAVRNKQGKQTGFKNERAVYNSDVYLEPEDAKRFEELTKIQ